MPQMQFTHTKCWGMATVHDRENQMNNRCRRQWEKKKQRTTQKGKARYLSGWFSFDRDREKQHFKSIALFVGILQFLRKSHKLHWNRLNCILERIMDKTTTIPHGIGQSDYFFTCVACSLVESKKNAENGKSTNSTFFLLSQVNSVFLPQLNVDFNYIQLVFFRIWLLLLLLVHLFTVSNIFVNEFPFLKCSLFDFLPFKAWKNTPEIFLLILLCSNYAYLVSVWLHIERYLSLFNWKGSDYY